MAIKTYQQGGLDGLCGVYSIVNAVRHLLRVQLEREVDEDLFKLVLRSIPAGEYPAVLWRGMAIDRLFLTARRVARYLRDSDSIEISVSRPFLGRRFQTARSLLDAVEALAANEGAVCILGVEGVCGDHWTVFRSRANGSLRLYDSGAMRKLSTRSLSLDDSRPYRLIVDETVAFRVVSINGEPMPGGPRA